VAKAKGEIVIDETLCTGCGICYYCCPEDVYRFDEDTKLPIIKYPKDCVGCLFCGLLCPTRAIDVTTTKGRKRPEAI